MQEVRLARGRNVLRGIACTFLLAIILLPLCCGGIHRVAAQSEEANGWHVYCEGRDKSVYRFDINENASGLEVWLFASMVDDYETQNWDDDWIELRVVGKPFSEGQHTVEPVVGLTKIGYKNDHERTAGGVHAIYYVLSETGFVSYVNVTLYAFKGTPRLDTSRSFMKRWDPVENVEQYVHEVSGRCQYNVSQDPTQECVGRAALESFGIPGEDKPMSSSLTWYFGKRVKPPRILGRNPDVYVEVGYAGGFNVAPELAYAGVGGYKCKINVGIGSGAAFIYAITSGREQTVYKVEKGTQPTLVAQTAADGMRDIALEVAEEIAESPALKLALKTLGYVFFALDLADIIISLGFDETVADSRILAFKNYKLGDEDFFVWFNFYSIIASAGVSACVANFWGECFTPITVGNLTLSVVNLPDGGMRIGGILFDYHDRLPQVGEPIVIREDGSLDPLIPAITTLIQFEAPKTYYLAGDLEATIVIDKNNVILDGRGHTVRGGVQVPYRCLGRENITITSLRIENGLVGDLILNAFNWIGIEVANALNATVSNNTIVGCQVGIAVCGALCTISGNNITNTGSGIGIYSCSGQSFFGEWAFFGEGGIKIFQNFISSCEVGIFDHNSWNPENITQNTLVRNRVGIRVEPNGAFMSISRNAIIQCGLGITNIDSTGEIAVFDNTILSCGSGIDCWGETVISWINNSFVYNYTLLISHNYIANCADFGIRAAWSNISENEILNCAQGIIVGHGSSIISGNNIINCHSCGVDAVDGWGSITYNNIAGTSVGIHAGWFNIQRNSITYCGTGAFVEGAHNCTGGPADMISENNFIKNGYGVRMSAGWNGPHVVTKNNFIMNNFSVFVETDCLTDVIAYVFHNNFIANGGARGDPPRCVWDNGYPEGGNYWSDYVGVDEKSGPNQDQPGPDGIGDKFYCVYRRAIDHYPLMEPVGILPPITFNYTVQGQNISLTSNSVLLDFKCDLENRTISFYVQGKSGTRGFVHLSIPKGLINGQAEVLFDGKPVPFNRSEAGDRVSISFEYEHSKHYVEVLFRAGTPPSGGIPPNYTILAAAVAVLLLAVILPVFYLRRKAKLPPRLDVSKNRLYGGSL